MLPSAVVATQTSPAAISFALTCKTLRASAMNASSYPQTAFERTQRSDNAAASSTRAGRMPPPPQDCLPIGSGISQAPAAAFHPAILLGYVVAPVQAGHLTDPARGERRGERRLGFGIA